MSSHVHRWQCLPGKEITMWSWAEAIERKNLSRSSSPLDISHLISYDIYSCLPEQVTDWLIDFILGEQGGPEPDVNGGKWWHRTPLCEYYLTYISSPICLPLGSRGMSLERQSWSLLVHAAYLMTVHVLSAAKVTQTCFMQIFNN